MDSGIFNTSFKEIACGIWSNAISANFVNLFVGSNSRRNYSFITEKLDWCDGIWKFLLL